MQAGNYSRQISMVWEQPRAWPELRALAEELLAACDALLRREQPDWIGHLKLLVVTDEGAAYASLTGAGEHITWRGALGAPAARAGVTLYAVVWGADEALVRAAVDQALGAET